MIGIMPIVEMVGLLKHGGMQFQVFMMVEFGIKELIVEMVIQEI